LRCFNKLNILPTAPSQRHALAEDACNFTLRIRLEVVHARALLYDPAGGKGPASGPKRLLAGKRLLARSPPPLSLLARKEIDGERWGPGVEERPLAGSQAASGLDLPCPPPSRRWESQGLKKAPGPHTSRWPSGAGNHLLDTRPMGEKN